MLELGAKLKTIKTDLESDKNLILKLAKTVHVCSDCGDRELDGELDSDYEFKWDFTIADITADGERLIITACEELIKGSKCFSCVLADMDLETEDEELGPYGGAFKDWDDFYLWKNGPNFLD